MQRTFVPLVDALKPSETSLDGNLVLVAREVHCIRFELDAIAP